MKLKIENKKVDVVQHKMRQITKSRSVYFGRDGN